MKTDFISSSSGEPPGAGVLQVLKSPLSHDYFQLVDSCNLNKLNIYSYSSRELNYPTHEKYEHVFGPKIFRIPTLHFPFYDVRFNFLFILTPTFNSTN